MPNDPGRGIADGAHHDHEWRRHQEQGDLRCPVQERGPDDAVSFPGYLHKALSRGLLTHSSEQPLRHSAILHLQQLKGNRSARTMMATSRAVSVQRTSSGPCGCAEREQPSIDTTDKLKPGPQIAQPEESLPVQAALGKSRPVQRDLWDDLKSAAGDVAGGVSTATGDVWGGVTGAASDMWHGATGAASDMWHGATGAAHSLEQGDIMGALGSYGSGISGAIKDVGGGLYGAATDVGGGLYGAATDYAGGAVAAAQDVLSGAPRAQNWSCDASCNLEGKEPQCQNARVTGSGTGPNEEQACRAAKRDATQKAPRGCYARHCRCMNCTNR